MNRIIGFFLISVFAIFLGSQITEGCLLVPYWKTLSADEFYDYYTQFGPLIERFYTILTIIASLIPIGVGIYCFFKKSSALRNSLLSSFFTMIFVALFYIYFKETNQQFYEASFTVEQLKSELEIWGNWHWARVLFEFLSLIFLILTLNSLTSHRSQSHSNKIA